MESKKASLIVCHHTEHRRILKEMEGTGAIYHPTFRETKSRVRVIPASEELLKSELAKLSIKIDDLPSIKIVANKFWKELVTIKDGKLALREDHERGLFEILETI